QFAVVYKARNNQDVNREEIIKTLASLVTMNGDYPHRVDLLNPDLTIVVEIVKGNFCVSVVKDFNKLKRYNIQSIVGLSGDKAEGNTEVKESEN
ncbi:THUMP domain-containing protein 1, partial [Geodia barretti]